MSKQYKRKYTEEIVFKFIENKGGILLSSYVGINTPIKIKCKFGHVTYPTFGNMKYKGTWCNKCSYDLKKTTWLENYGVDNPGKSKEIKDKIKNTNRQKYGNDCGLQNEKIKEKGIATCIEKYGVKNYSQTKEFKERFKNTSLKKYGTKHPHQNRNILMKALKSMNNSGIIPHWETGEELVWVASYERKFLEWANKCQKNYLWQPIAFETPFKTKTGKISTYRPDVYLIDEDEWIEIKGRIAKDAESKWSWFHEKYPNSELWNGKKLKELGIL